MARTTAVASRGERNPDPRTTFSNSAALNLCGDETAFCSTAINSP